VNTHRDFVGEGRTPAAFGIPKGLWKQNGFEIGRVSEIEIDDVVPPIDALATEPLGTAFIIFDLTLSGQIEIENGDRIDAFGVNPKAGKDLGFIALGSGRARFVVDVELADAQPAPEVDEKIVVLPGFVDQAPSQLELFADDDILGEDIGGRAPRLEATVGELGLPAQIPNAPPRNLLPRKPVDPTGITLAPVQLETRSRRCHRSNTRWRERHLDR
jgi:hypothetical protein